MLALWSVADFHLPRPRYDHGPRSDVCDCATAAMQGIQLSFFLNGIAIAGGAPLITQFGVGTEEA